MLIYLAYITILLLILYYFYTRNYDYWKSKGVPYDEPFFIFGSFYKIAARQQHIAERIREIYSKFNDPCVGIYAFNQPQLLVRSPEMLKSILVRDFDKFANRNVATNEKVDPIAFHTLFSAKDVVWKKLRAKISPVFTSGKMKMMLPLMKECAQDLNDNLRRHQGETVEVRMLTKKYAVDIISSCAFGINAKSLKSGEDSEIFQVAMKLLDMNSFKRGFAIFCFFFIPKFVDIFRLRFADKEAAQYLMDVFKNALKQREEKNIVRHDLIDLLHSLKTAETDANIDGYKFDDIKMAAQAITFFSAGNDTTSLIISYTLYELALNPQIQNRLRAEIQETYKKHGDFTYEAIHEMKYLDMVLNESLRKYPLTTFLNRQSLTKYTFEETGFTVDKDVTILVPVSGLHFDPEYFPDPEKFDPERFSDENKKNIKPYTYMPFGEGPRNCIGQRFGILVSKIGLIYAVKDFAFEKCNETPIPIVYNPLSIFLQNKKGLPLKVVRV